MRHSPESFNTISTEETIEKVRELHAELLEVTKEESAILREQGFPVDDECRIIMDEFPGIENITKTTLAIDKQDAERALQDLKRKDEIDPTGSEIRKKSGELLEMVKTTGMNRFWSNGRLIAVRTSRFDDVRNGVDNLIFDTMTGEPVAAFDEAAGGGVWQKDPERLLRNITRGVEVKYGLSYNDGVVEKQTYRKENNPLPLFIIRVTLEELEVLAKDLALHKITVRGAEIIKSVFANLATQAGTIKSKANPNLRNAYENARIMFSEVQESLETEPLETVKD